MDGNQTATNNSMDAPASSDEFSDRKAHLEEYMREIQARLEQNNLRTKDLWCRFNELLDQATKLTSKPPAMVSQYRTRLNQLFQQLTMRGSQDAEIVTTMCKLVEDYEKEIQGLCMEVETLPVEVQRVEAEIRSLNRVAWQARTEIKLIRTKLECLDREAEGQAAEDLELQAQKDKFAANLHLFSARTAAEAEKTDNEAAGITCGPPNQGCNML